MQMAAGYKGGGGERGRASSRRIRGGGTWSHTAGAAEEDPAGVSVYSSKCLWCFHLIYMRVQIFPLSNSSSSSSPSSPALLLFLVVEDRILPC